VHGSTLRSRPLFEKAQIAEEIRAKLWSKFDKGGIRPVIHGVFSMAEAEKALDLMEEGLNIGKILIRM
jgi:NADPH2:quinone reductase